MPLTLRHAAAVDAAAVAGLINRAYRVEDFFKIGDRTDTAEILEKIRTGAFLLLGDGSGAPAGAVYVATHGRVGYFGMLSIEPACQGQGLGARLIAAAEDHCRAAGCDTMELEVVDLRTELPPFYRKFGYVESGTRPFPSLERTSRPCHFIVMTRALAPR